MTMIQTETLRWHSRTDAATGVRVYRLEGVLGDSEESHAFLTAAREDMRADPRRLLLDLGGVVRMTSAGVSIVIAVHKAAVAADRAIALAALSRRNEMILEIAQIFSFIPAFDDECAALDACAADGWALSA
jgi:anti-anti-sigma regulatory factor